MATVATPPRFTGPQWHPDGDIISTIPDPRSPAPSPHPSRNPSLTSSQHPDHNSEVEALSNKLISAINYQTSLDDTLAATRHELEAAKQKLRKLEAANQEHADMLATGMLVKRTEVEGETLQLRGALDEEKKQRGVAEKDKKNIEQELENLTTALFEEANKMVAAARKDREAVERKNDQLRSQLNDTELLLASHQEQLTELKTVMQQMSSDRDETETNTNISTAPSTPALGTQDGFSRTTENLHLSPNGAIADDVSPAQPLSFSHLIHPILRNDLQAYEDFRSLLQAAKSTAPPSRASSGSYGGLNMMGLRNFASSSQLHANATASANASAATPGPSPTSPVTPASNNSAGSGKEAATSLRDTPFYKRVLIEDLEPTLRLDTAPGLSWLARRTVIHSMSDGSLVVEPMPASSRRYTYTCSLCGECRKGDEYARTHRFKSSDSDSAQRYPLCNFCLGRVRASCDFLGFLRMIKDGHWRVDGPEGEKAAWEESVRLRERMFWTRIGGGVVPAFVQIGDSPRPSASHDRVGEDGKDDFMAGRESVESKDVPRDRVTEDIFHSDVKRASIGNKIISRDALTHVTTGAMGSKEDINEGELADNNPQSPTDARIENQTAEELRKNVRNSMALNVTDIGKLKDLDAESSSSEAEPRLSLTIPGAFEEV
ncbi:MAG: hypothetical protein M1819_007480 [Sarea resinae]|nr:MAG: hypothetical protein M1819_007480 [Sarea resinae]